MAVTAAESRGHPSQARRPRSNLAPGPAPGIRNSRHRSVGRKWHRARLHPYADRGFSALLDAINPNLRAFRSRGGKILQSHLWNSVVHPAARSIEYYEQVVGLMNGGSVHKAVLEHRDFRQTQEFYRLFMGPGGAGSNAPGTFDSMPDLVGAAGALVDRKSGVGAERPRSVDHTVC